LRNLNRERKKEAKKLLNQSPTKFEQIDLSKHTHPFWMTRAFRNNRYTVMIQDDHPTSKGTAIRCMIQNHFDKPINGHWREIQDIKNEIFGKESEAVEFYPKESELVDDHNIYWIWIFPENHLPKIIHANNQNNT